MCNHYRILHPELALAMAGKFAEEHEQPAWEITSDAWPGASMPVIYQRDLKTLAAMRWGCERIEKGVRAGLTVNARDDMLEVRPMWKNSILTRRCLVPADGFYEWAGPEGAKWEVLFQIPDLRPFFFAGIWSWDEVGGARGFAIVTGKVHPVVAQISHERTPVILSETDAYAWIGNQPLPAGELERLCKPYSGNLVREDMPRLARSKTSKRPPVTKIAPVDQPELF